MNAIREDEPSPAVPDAVLARLAALPSFEADARLDWRVRQSLARHRPVAPRWIGMAAAAGLAAVAGAWVLSGSGPVGAPVAGDDGLARVQALEAEVLAVRGGDGTSRIDALWAETELARIDRALQSAYDRGAAAAELAPLWQAREDALRQVLDAYRAPASVVHI